MMSSLTGRLVSCFLAFLHDVSATPHRSGTNHYHEQYLLSSYRLRSPCNGVFLVILAITDTQKIFAILLENVSIWHKLLRDNPTAMASSCL